MRIVKVPSSHGSPESMKGCELAPAALCKGLNCDEIIVMPTGLETDKSVFEKAKELARERPLFVGGDHSITYSIFSAFSREFEHSGLLVLDAHADAAVTANTHHEAMNRELIDNGLLEKERLMIFGVRKMLPREQAFINGKKIKVVGAEWLKKEKIAFEALKHFVGSQKNLYVSWDIDALDPSIAPGTGIREKGGISEQQAFEIIEMLIESKKMRGFDLVEINPQMDINGKTVALGRKIMEKLFAEW